MHHELFFPDGSCPDIDIVDAFLQIAGTAQGERRGWAWNGFTVHITLVKPWPNKTLTHASPAHLQTLYVDSELTQGLMLRVQVVWRSIARQGWEGQAS